MVLNRTQAAARLGVTDAELTRLQRAGVFVGPLVHDGVELWLEDDVDQAKGRLTRRQSGRNMAQDLEAG